MTSWWTRMCRVGYGVDFHRFETGRRLVLGGVEVPWSRGLAGHSDADVVLHALSDALLGAAGLGDIGRYFPDTDAAYKDADSRLLLGRVVAMVSEAGWEVVNADLTLILQEPKVAPYREAMEREMGRILGCEAVNLKATTPERLGAIGRGEGVECRAVVLLRRRGGGLRPDCGGDGR